MLQIRLRKAANSEVAASKPVASENVTVSCPDYLVLADLPVGKTVGSVSAVNVVRIVGRRSRRQVGSKVHFCVRCNLPIAIYGRLSPCEHAFCLTCARSESSCYLCDDKIQKIQTVKMLDGIFICAAPHCLKSFLKRKDFEMHLIETHSDLFQCISGKNEFADKDVLKTRPVSSDLQPTKLSSQPQQKGAFGTSVTCIQGEEKLPHDLPKGSFGTQQQEEQISTQQHYKNFSYHQQPQEQWDYHSNSGDSSQQLYQEKQRNLEIPHHQSPQEKRQKHTHGEKHRKHQDKRQEIHEEKQMERIEGPHHEDIHQMDTEHQNVHWQQPQNQLTLKLESPLVMPPSFPMQPFQYPYSFHPEGIQQHYFPHSNQGIAIQAPLVQDIRETQFRSWDISLSGMPREATTTIYAPRVGSRVLDMQQDFSHFPTNNRPGMTSMLLDPSPQSMITGLDNSLHYEDSTHCPLIPTSRKEGRHFNMHTQGVDVKEVHNHRGRGGRPSVDANPG